MDIRVETLKRCYGIDGYADMPLAGSKAEAYDKVVYEILPEVPYSAWVSSVTYNNGNYREFNTHEGMPY